VDRVSVSALAAASYAASDDKGLASTPPVIYALFIADFCNKICQKRSTPAASLDHLVGAVVERCFKARTCLKSYGRTAIYT